MTDKELINSAIMAQANAYAPYSSFKVGAALLAKSGKVYLGCNVENASYSSTNCAERTAIFNAVSNGELEFEKIVIVGGNTDDFVYPCGACRQVMSEFCNDDFMIILYKKSGEIFKKKLGELLPCSFKFSTKE